ncbi:MAG: hypothetical protein OXR66_07030 [Candidatus Woesearchaeota archaeon]|nr:hypothetical protein [Candidatus Woesearchaeota archaeon]
MRTKKLFLAAVVLVAALTVSNSAFAIPSQSECEHWDFCEDGSQSIYRSCALNGEDPDSCYQEAFAFFIGCIIDWCPEEI